MEFDAKAFSNILKTLCGYYGSINKLADKTGITASYICKLIKLKYKEAPSPKILRKIADNSDGLFTYLELMYICGYFREDEYNILKKV
jgi:transcriptional regulator with XRE-family HTH domain